MQESYVELITIDELCELLLIGRSTAYKLLRSGELKPLKSARYGKYQRHRWKGT